MTFDEIISKNITQCSVYDTKKYKIRQKPNVLNRNE